MNEIPFLVISDRIAEIIYLFSMKYLRRWWGGQSCETFFFDDMIKWWSIIYVSVDVWRVQFIFVSFSFVNIFFLWSDNKHNNVYNNEWTNGKMFSMFFIFFSFFSPSDNDAKKAFFFTSQMWNIRPSSYRVRVSDEKTFEGKV